MADPLAEPLSQTPIRVDIEGNQLALIESGEQRLDLLLKLIGEARHSIKILMYMVNPDSAGTQVRDALVSAAQCGVEVKLMIDGFGSSARPDFFKTLSDAGGRHCVFNPSYGRRYLMRNHQKLVVIDDRTVIIGGANIDCAYLSDDGPNHWRDLWLRLDGTAAEVPGEYFDTLFRWSTQTRPKLAYARRRMAEFSQRSGVLQWKFSGPLSVRNSWWRSIGRDIRRGQKLDMVFAYFAPPGAMVRRIGRLGRRGQARIITADKSDNNATIAAARHSFSRLLRRHVQMYEYLPAKLHTKLAIVDDIVHIGSSNFDYRSLYINMEIMLRIRNARFADAMRCYFERELEDCRRITPELHRRRSNPWRRLKWALSHFLVNVMDYSVTRRLNFRTER